MENNKNRVRCPRCCTRNRDSILKVDPSLYICTECGCSDSGEYFEMDADELVYCFKKGANGEMELYFGYDENAMVSTRSYLQHLLDIIESDNLL